MNAAGHRVVARLLVLIAQHGGNPGAILRARGFDQPLQQFISEVLPSLDGGDLQTLAAHASVAVSDMQARAAGRPMFRSGDWRLLFYCLIGSRTLGEAIMRMEELLAAIDGRMGMVAFRRSGILARLTYDGLRAGDEEMDFIIALHGHLMFHAIFSWLIAKPLAGRVALDFPETARAHIRDEILPFELAFDAPRPEMTFAAHLLDQPIVRDMEDCEALPTLNFLLGLKLEANPSEIVRRAQRLMSAALKERSRLPSLDELARDLALGRMTLRRRLHAAGTSFNSLREALRQDMAIDLLNHSPISIEEVAERLGFCDSDAFRRAFRAWTGMAPTQFRRKTESGSVDR